jgi:hypothetical protein
LVQLLFEFQVNICVHVHAWAAWARGRWRPSPWCDKRVSFQVTQPDRAKGTSNLVLLWAQTRGNAAYSKRVVTQSDVSGLWQPLCPLLPSSSQCATSTSLSHWRALGACRMGHSYRAGSFVEVTYSW